MALSREDKADVKGAMGKAIANKVSKVTRDGGWGEVHKRAAEIRAARKSASNGTPKLNAHTAKLRAEGKLHKSTGMAPDSPFHNVTHINRKKIR